jgi:hypothetical protein
VEQLLPRREAPLLPDPQQLGELAVVEAVEQRQAAEVSDVHPVTDHAVAHQTVAR